MIIAQASCKTDAAVCSKYAYSAASSLILAAELEVGLLDGGPGGSPNLESLSQAIAWFWTPDARCFSLLCWVLVHQHPS